MNNRIKKVVAEMGLTNKKVFTLGELEKIAQTAKCKVIDVMKYLRFER